MKSYFFTFLSIIFLVASCTKNPGTPEPEQPAVKGEVPTDIAQCSEKDMKVLTEIDKANPKLELFKDKNPKEWKGIDVKWVKDAEGKFRVRSLSVNEKSIPEESVLSFELSKKNEMVFDSLVEVKMSSASLDKIIIKNQPVLKNISIDGLLKAPAKNIDVNENKLLQSLDVAGFGKLSEFDLEKGSVELLKLKDLPLLKELSPKAQIKTLIFEGDFSKLDYVYLTNNEIETVKFSEAKLPVLEYLTLNKNKLKEINIAGIPKLSTLNLRNNMLEKVSISDCAALKTLDMGMNKDLAHVTLSGMKSLSSYDVSETSITTFSTKDFPVLKKFNAKAAQISSVDLTGASNLEVLNLQSNKLTKIDLSHCKKMEMLILDTNMLERLDIPYLASEGRVQVKHNKLVALNFSSGVKGNVDELEIEDNRLHYTELKKIKEQATPASFLYALQNVYTGVDDTKKQIDASEYKTDGIEFVIQKANGQQWENADLADYSKKDAVYTFVKPGKYRVVAQRVPGFSLFNLQSKTYCIGELSL